MVGLLLHLPDVIPNFFSPLSLNRTWFPGIYKSLCKVAMDKF